MNLSWWLERSFWGYPDNEAVVDDVVVSAIAVLESLTSRITAGGIRARRQERS